MKKKIKYIAIIAFIIITIYSVIARSGLPLIKIDNVKAVSIECGLTVTQLNVDENRKEINNLISMYNKARRYYKEGDTTPSAGIVFELKSGEMIIITGIEDFQYVVANGKQYKIHGKELSKYFKGFDKSIEKINANK